MQEIIMVRYCRFRHTPPAAPTSNLLLVQSRSISPCPLQAVASGGGTATRLLVDASSLPRPRPHSESHLRPFLLGPPMALHPSPSLGLCSRTVVISVGKDGAPRTCRRELGQKGRSPTFYLLYFSRGLCWTVCRERMSANIYIARCSLTLEMAVLKNNKDCDSCFNCY